MSSDLVKRLRGPYDSETQLVKRCLVAAAAIEALEGEVAALRADNSVWDKERYETLQMWIRKTEAAEARVERLREALEKLLDGDDHMTACEKTMGPTHLCTCGAKYIRKALEDDKQ
jgi:DNA repair exonuclease SbcCD ATPase subunit